MTSTFVPASASMVLGSRPRPTTLAGVAEKVFSRLASASNSMVFGLRRAKADNSGQIQNGLGLDLDLNIMVSASTFTSI